MYRLTSIVELKISSSSSSTVSSEAIIGGNFSVIATRKSIQRRNGGEATTETGFCFVHTYVGTIIIHDTHPISNCIAVHCERCDLPIYQFTPFDYHSSRLHKAKRQFGARSDNVGNDNGRQRQESTAEVGNTVRRSSPTTKPTKRHITTTYL